MQLVDCKAIVASNLTYPSISQALNSMKRKIPVVLVENDSIPEGTIRFAELAEDLNVDRDCLKKVNRGPNDLAILPFSSGTTGFPKGVVLSHKSVIAMNHMIADPEIVAIKETTGKMTMLFVYSRFWRPWAL